MIQRRGALTGSMAHIFTCSFFIIVKNSITYGLDSYSAIDIALQLSLMMETWKQFLRYWAEAAQNVHNSLQTVLVYSAANVVVTQFCRALQQYYIWLWEFEDEEQRATEETERERGELVCISTTIQHYSFTRPDAPNTHTECAKLDQHIARNKTTVEPFRAQHALAGSDVEEPPSDPTLLATYQNQLQYDWATPLPGALLNLECLPQQ